MSTIAHPVQLLLPGILRRCSKCGQDKLTSEYPRDKRKKSGLAQPCCECKRLYGRQYVAEHKEVMRERLREWRKKNPEKDRETRRRNNRKWAERYPDKARAKFRRWAALYPGDRVAAYKKYREAHPERVAATRLAYRLSGRETLCKRKYRELNKERLRVLDREWCARNPEKVQAKYHRRATAKRNAGGSFSAQEWSDLKRLYGFRCLACGRHEPDIKLTVDHVIPVSKGGSNSITNIQPLCGSCNYSKRDKQIDYRHIQSPSH